MRLNIMGNGFDLYHGLPCSYYYFGCYLISNHEDFYEKLADMYGFVAKKVVSVYPDLEFKWGVEDVFWGEFEKHLGDVDSSWVENTLQDDLGLENDDPVDLDLAEYENSEQIKQMFSEWVYETLDKAENFEIVDRILKHTDAELQFDGEECFINFNYTHTLEKIYNIEEDRILHIHGECLTGEFDDLVIGHCNDERIKMVAKQLEEYEENDYDQETRNRKNEYSCILANLKDLRKNVAQNILTCNYFLERSKKVTEVCVYGLSFGEVDIPYMKNIRNKYPNAKWKVSYYSLGEKKEKAEILQTILNLTEDDFELFEFSNPCSNKITREIVKLQGIQEFEMIKSSFKRRKVVEK